MSSPWCEWQLNLPLLSLPMWTHYSAGCYSVCLVCHVPRLHLLKNHFLTPSSSICIRPSSTYPSICPLTHLSTHRLSIYPCIYSFIYPSIHLLTHTFTHPSIQLTIIHPPTYSLHLSIYPFLRSSHPPIHPLSPLSLPIFFPSFFLFSFSCLSVCTCGFMCVLVWGDAFLQIRLYIQVYMCVFVPTWSAYVYRHVCVHVCV